MAIPGTTVELRNTTPPAPNVGTRCLSVKLMRLRKMVKIWVPESIKAEKTMFEDWPHAFVVIKGRFDMAEIILSEGQASELIKKLQDVLETI